MISNEKVAELGKALAKLYLNYTAEDFRKVLDHALQHRKMLGYPHDLAEMLEGFAKELRRLPQKPDPLADRWKRDLEKKKQRQQ